MATRVENISSGKVIGFGTVNILPGETKTIPKEYESSPALKFYEDNGFARVTEVPDAKEYLTSEQVMNALDGMKPDTDASEAAPVESESTPAETEAAPAESKPAPAESAEEPRKDKKAKSSAKS